MKLSADQIAARVVQRANDRCEYCQMHQSLQGATFHIEHVLPASRGGAFDLENLAWCCPSCNLQKSNRIEAIDPKSGVPVPLFNPRRSAWADHFHWDNYQLIGDTAEGRATIVALDLNRSRRLLIRRAEERFGLFPPETHGNRL